jgi:TonB family protein
VKRICVCLAVTIGVAFLSVSAAAAERSWVEIKTDHFTVVSDAGEKRARAIGWEFEQIRLALASLWSWARVDADRPILIVAANDESTMKALAPQYWEQKGAVHPESVFVTGPDRHYILLRSDVKVSDTQALNPYRAAYWSYTALVLRSSAPRELPLWYFLGLVEVMSNTIVRETHIDVGHAIPWHLRRLRDHSRMPVAELLAADSKSPWFQQADRRPDFDAAAWSLVHYLMFADEGAHRQQLDRFAALVLDGQTPAGAAETVFGNLQTLDGAIAQYMTRQLFGYIRLNVDLKLKADSFPSRAMAAGESGAAQASVHLAMQRPVDARASIERARKENSNLAASFDAEALLLDMERKTADAQAMYAKAMELGSTNFYTYYRWASLAGLGDAPDRARIDQALQKATALNDRFAAAWTLLAEARLRLGQREDALKFAQRAGATAATDGERLAAQRLIELSAKSAPPAQSGEWPPAGVSRPNRDGVRLPRLVREVKPKYTAEAMRAKIQGTVALECVVLPDGKVGAIRVVRSLDSTFGLDQEAMAAAKQWQFEPGAKDGLPVPVLITVELTFTLGKTPER